MYKLLRNILFLFDAEQVHLVSMKALKGLRKIGFLRRFLEKKYHPKTVFTEAFGLKFKNPVGLAAGFDKNATYLSELKMLGFGFIEIGTVTPLPQKGNEKPRLFRLPKDKAIINRMGFNNEGVKTVAERLRKWRTAPGVMDDDQAPVIGGNIGKNKNTANEDAWKDYEICFNELFDCVDYFVVNVSSPNTPGLRELQQKDSLKKILSHLQDINQQQPFKKPLLLKISPDLTQPEIDDIIELAVEINLSGIIAANTTISREHLNTAAAIVTKAGSGGLSGKPLQQVSTKMVKYLADKTNGQVPVIASGGIFTGGDAREKQRAGAALVQVWTGFIYEGPSIVKNICSGLAQ